MNTIELLLLLVILMLQVGLFVQTTRRVRGFRGSIPEARFFSIHKEQLAADEQVKVTRLVGPAAESAAMLKIRKAINTYLERNRGAVADFNLLKDIVQRNLDTLEEEITLTLPLPLYLGLLGTMGGIVIGLWNMPVMNIRDFVSGQGVSNLEGVNILITGVKYAMMASFAGLLFTVINSYLFRDAKVRLENRKHDFLTFLQTELLPLLTESVNSGIYDLNRSLDRFGAQFSQTAVQLEGIITKNYDALTVQRELLGALEKMDLSRVATFNVQVLSELQRSLGALERFGDFLNTLNALTDNARQLVQRTDDVVGLSEQIRRIFEESQQLQRFLNSHFDQLEARGQLINQTVVQMDDVVAKSLDGLAQHTYERIQAVRNITLKEEDQMIRAFAENRNVLGNLKYLEQLERDVKALYTQGDQRQREVQGSLNGLIISLKQTNETLLKMQERMERNVVRDTLGRWFNGKRATNGQP